MDSFGKGCAGTMRATDCLVFLDECFFVMIYAPKHIDYYTF